MIPGHFEANCRTEIQPVEGVTNDLPVDEVVTSDPAVLKGEAAAAHGFVAVLKTLREIIARLDQPIEQLVASDPDMPCSFRWPELAQYPARLIVAFGTARKRNETAFQMQCYSGIGWPTHFVLTILSTEHHAADRGRQGVSRSDRSARILN